MTQTTTVEKPKPFLLPQYCKGCGRCIESCPKHCITAGTEIDPLTGLIPVLLDLEACNGCGLCITACPEPYGLLPETDRSELIDPRELFGERECSAPYPVDVADSIEPLPDVGPLILKGTYASTVG